jgi:hypothetical protein
MADYKHEKTSLGECWVVARMTIVDEVPNLLASRLPIWLREEWALLKTLPPVARKSLWDGRLKALDDERAERAKDPLRTATRGTSQDGHLARMKLGHEARGKQALALMLAEAMALLAEIAAGEWTEPEQAQDWRDRYEALKGQVDGN